MSKIMKLAMSILLGLMCLGAFASSYYTPEKTPVHVRSYYRSNGTYVHSYYRAKSGGGSLN